MDNPKRLPWDRSFEGLIGMLDSNNPILSRLLKKVLILHLIRENYLMLIEILFELWR